MTKFQTITFVSDIDDLNELLSRMDDHGWELVSAVAARWTDNTGNNRVTAYRLFFKRPKAEG